MFLLRACSYNCMCKVKQSEVSHSAVSQSPDSLNSFFIYPKSPDSLKCFLKSFFESIPIESLRGVLITRRVMEHVQKKPLRTHF